jgi:methylmalonyl-CoA mutase C-terminal domain/subunit
MEVIYAGLRQTPEMIVSTAIQEDVDAIGLSCLSGAHMHLFSKVMALLQERGAQDILVFVGGTIPDEDIPTLKAWGVQAIFTPGTSTREAIAFVQGRSTAPDIARGRVE